MQRSDPKLTLGIPVYNGAVYLGQLFDCLCAQTFTDYEAIISDNASIDATEPICRDVVAASDSRPRYYRNPRNIGAAPNFNRVFQLASSRYFKWTAHDHLLTQTYLERRVAVRVSICHAAIQVINAELHSLGCEPSADGLLMRGG